MCLGKNEMSYCSGPCQLPFSWVISLLSWTHIGLTLCSQPLLDSIPLHQAVVPSKQDVVTTVATICFWFTFAQVLLLPWCFSTGFIWKKQTDNKCEWDDMSLFRLLMFYIWQSWTVLHCWIALPLQKFTF